MKVKGFTLVELLGVIAILGLIALIAYPSVMSSLKRGVEKDYKRFLKDLQLATESYVNNNLDNFNLLEPGDNKFIELIELVENEYLNKKIVNPKTKEQINLKSTMLVTVLNDYTKSYEYTNTEASINNYVYNSLIVMYDGYKKPYMENDKLMWGSVVNDYKGEIVSSGIDVWNDNKIKLDENCNYIKVLDSDNIIPNDSEVTIEIVYKGLDNEIPILKNRGLGLYYFDLYADGLIRSMVKNSENTANFWPQATSLELIKPNKLHTLGITMSKNGDNFDFNYHGDGVKLETSSVTGKKSTNLEFTIGKDHSESPTLAYIYGFRLYNKTLSEEEIFNNYKVDLNRYNWR